MTWNYRVIRHGETEDFYAVHEVYYDKDGTPHSWSTNPKGAGGSTPEELTAELDRMRVALTKPVLVVASTEDGGQTLREL